MDPQIREATAGDWPILREFLVKKLPSSMSILSVVKMEEKFDISRKIYVTNPDPTLFIFAFDVATNVPNFATFWDSERLTREEVKRCLKSIPGWDWSYENFMFCRVDASLAMQLENMILGKEFTARNLERSFDPRFLTFELPPENLTKPGLPKGFKIGVLKPHHVPHIFTYWKYSSGESVKCFEESLQNLPSAAVYKEEENENDNPVSWCLLYTYGMIGMTYTLPEFRRLGLGKAVVSSLCEKLVEFGIPINTDVKFENKSSEAMHKKLGFKVIGEVFWGNYKSK